jgi:hypothetical protein
LLKLGFNDIGVRDQHLPGIIATLVWYQWSLGLLYVTLLLGTFSRTIPGLNLLIYLQFPGIIATLVWYQWSLGLLYVTLLLGTFSRTIPGLNLLIYLQ